MNKKEMVKAILKERVSVDGRDQQQAEKYLYNKFNKYELFVLYDMVVNGKFLDEVKYYNKNRDMYQPVAFYTVEAGEVSSTYDVMASYEQDVEMGYKGTRRQHRKDWVDMYISALEDDDYYIFDDRSLYISWAV